MPRYLLSSRTVLDIIQRKGLPGELWLTMAAKDHGVTARDLCISAVTPMAVRREIDRRLDLIKRGRADPHFSRDDLLQMRRNAEALFREFGSEQRIISMTAAIASRWGELLDQAIDYRGEDGTTYSIGSVQKLEIATAIIGRNDIPFMYVERSQPGLSKLNGLAVEDPTRKVTMDA